MGSRRRLGFGQGRGERVGVLFDVFEPEPLDDGGFEEAGGGVGVVLEELGRVAAVVGEVEAAVEGELVLVPGADDPGDELRGDLEEVEEVVVDHVLDGLEAHVVEGVGGGFELVDFLRGEEVADGFVPVGLVVDGVEVEALAFDGGLPVGAGLEGEAEHGVSCQLLVASC